MLDKAGLCLVVIDESLDYQIPYIRAVDHDRGFGRCREMIESMGVKAF